MELHMGDGLYLSVAKACLSGMFDPADVTAKTWTTVNYPR
jgi:hypothetical protein